MKENELVSIITATYNASAYMEATLTSILSQTYRNWELLITDDCSKDDTWAKLQTWAAKDQRIKVFRLDTNSGAGIARNNSIQHAQGRYIAFCDSDDQWLPTKLEEQLAFMHERDCAFSYTSYFVRDEDGRDKGMVKCRKSLSYMNILSDNKVGCLTALYDTQKVGKMFMPDLRKRQDWGLWINIIKKCGIAYGLQKPLAVYLDRAGSISSNKLSLVKYNYAVYRKSLGFSALKSTAAMLFLFFPSYMAKKLTQKVGF